MDLTTETESSLSSKSLESKIHSFLHGNPAFSTFDLGLSTIPAVGGDNMSPVPGTDTQDGTPVRDEGGGTPTQDEIMDKPTGLPFPSSTKPATIGETVKSAPIAYQNSTLQNPNNLQKQVHLQPAVTQNGNLYQSYPYSEQEMSEHSIATPVAHYQPISAQSGGPVPGERAPGSASSIQTVGGFQGVNEGGWYGDTYPEGSSQQPTGYNMIMPGGAGENKISGHYPYQAEQTQGPQKLASQQGSTSSSSFYRNTLPPVPKLPPPPPIVFDDPTSASSGAMILPEQQPPPSANAGEGLRSRGDSVISGMVVHDHQHKSMFHPGNPPYEHGQPRPRPPDLHPHPDDLHYQEGVERYHDEPHRRDGGFYQNDPYGHSEDPYYRPGSPPHHYPQERERFTPPLSPSEDPYYAPDYQRHSPPHPPHYTPRRPPPHLEIRHPGMRPPHRPLHPPHPAHHPHPRGPPQAPFPRFHGPDPRLRGKRPVPRGRGNPGPMFPPKRPFPPPRY